MVPRSAISSYEDHRTQLQEVLRAIRHELSQRSMLSAEEQRLLISIVSAEVELGRGEPQLARIGRAIELSLRIAGLSRHAERGRELLSMALAQG